MELRQPTVETDGGPWAVHDQPCAICGKRHAVLHLSDGIFGPCGDCVRAGWALVHAPGWRRRLVSRLSRWTS